MNLHLFNAATYSWLACASIMTVVAVMLGYFYTHIKISKQSTKSAAPSPGTPKTKPDSAESTDLKAKCDNDKDTVTDDATDTEDATTEDVSKVKEEFADRKWPIDCPMSENSTKSVQDPVTFCEHIQSEVKKAEQKFATKKLREEMTTDQIAEERVIQQQQLSAIFKMMEDDSDKFGISSLGDMTEQMKLYM